MDWEVEVHAVSAEAAALFRRRPAAGDGERTETAHRGAAHGDAAYDDVASADAFQASMHQAVDTGVQLFVCPAALAQAGLAPADLIADVAGVRGAAALLAAASVPDARLLNF